MLEKGKNFFSNKGLKMEIENQPAQPGLVYSSLQVVSGTMQYGWNATVGKVVEIATRWLTEMLSRGRLGDVELLDFTARTPEERSISRVKRFFFLNQNREQIEEKLSEIGNFVLWTSSGDSLSCFVSIRASESEVVHDSIMVNSENKLCINGLEDQFTTVDNLISFFQDRDLFWIGGEH